MPTSLQQETPKIGLGLVIALCICFLFDAVQLLSQGLYGIRDTGILDPVEPSVVYAALQVTRGEPIYSGFEALPFIFNLYTPLYYLLVGKLAVFLGLQDIDGIIAIGRSVNLVAGILAAAAAGGIVYATARNVGTAILATLLVFHLGDAALFDIYHVRPDVAALSFTLLGLLAFVARAPYWPYLAAALMAIAFGFKQSYLVAPTVLAFHLLRNGNLSALRAFTGFYLLGVLTVVYTGYAYGDRFLSHALIANAASQMHPAYYFKLFAEWVYLERWGLFLAVCATSIVLFLKQRINAQPLFAYFVLSLLYTTVIQSKSGASLNYHMEITIAAIIISCATIGHFLQRPGFSATALLLVLTIAYFADLSDRDGLIRHYRCGFDDRINHKCNYAHSSIFDNRGYLDHYRHEVDSVLSFDHDLAARMGNPVVLDWNHVEILQQSPRPLDLGKLEGLIVSRKYRKLLFPVFGNSPGYTAHAYLLYKTALRYGYEETYNDGHLLEISLANSGSVE